MAGSNNIPRYKIKEKDGLITISRLKFPPQFVVLFAIAMLFFSDFFGKIISSLSYLFFDKFNILPIELIKEFSPLLFIIIVGIIFSVVYRLMPRWSIVVDTVNRQIHFSNDQILSLDSFKGMDFNSDIKGASWAIMTR